MQTETWIERVCIDQLTTHDRRYKHDYGGVEQTTDDLIVACRQLDLMTSGDELASPSLDQLLEPDTDLEAEIEATLQSLQDRGLIECVGEQDRLGPPFEPGDYGTTRVWKPTEEGRGEASAIRDAFAAEVEALEESYDSSSKEFKTKLAGLARTYGILPNLFS